MSVKVKSALFRDLLYFNEVVKCRQISSAARQNGIKASNLSKQMKDLEEQLHKKLFLRDSRGILPTNEALQLAEKVKKIEQLFDEMLNGFIFTHPISEIKIYLPDNLHFKNYEKYATHTANYKIVKCESKKLADIIIGYEAPQNRTDLIVVKNQIGGNISQDIWVSCVNTPQAVKIAESIIHDLHDSHFTAVGKHF